MPQQLLLAILIGRQVNDEGPLALASVGIDFAGDLLIDPLDAAF